MSLVACFVLFVSNGGIIRIGDGVDRGDSVKDNDTICHVGGHDKVMLHNEGGLFRVEDEPDRRMGTEKKKKKKIIA